MQSASLTLLPFDWMMNPNENKVNDANDKIPTLTTMNEKMSHRDI
jgi:hypothetical protein